PLDRRLAGRRPRLLRPRWTDLRDHQAAERSARVRRTRPRAGFPRRVRLARAPYTRADDAAAPLPLADVRGREPPDPRPVLRPHRRVLRPAVPARARARLLRDRDRRSLPAVRAPPPPPL